MFLIGAPHFKSLVLYFIFLVRVQLGVELTCRARFWKCNNEAFSFAGLVLQSTVSIVEVIYIRRLT